MSHAKQGSAVKILSNITLIFWSCFGRDSNSKTAEFKRGIGDTIFERIRDHKIHWMILWQVVVLLNEGHDLSFITCQPADQ